MNITNHCLDRYTERILGISDTQTMKQYIAQNRDMLVKDIERILEYANMVYTGQINGDKSTKNYWLRDNIVIVTDTGNSTAITLYKIDFGFGEKTDKMITSNLLDEITIFREKICNIKSEIDNNVEYKKTEIGNIENEITALKEQIFMLEFKKNTLENEVKVAYNEVEMLNKNLEVRALKICNSAEYRKDLAKLNSK